MTTEFRNVCAELLAAIQLYTKLNPAASDMSPFELTEKLMDAMAATGAALAQPVAEEPTDGELYELWVQNGFEIDRFARAVLARWGRPTPQPVWADIHYAWELHDAEGEWQAGGSANSLEDVQREGNRYLQTYSQDGPHKLIIQRHCVSTIEEAQQ